MMDGWSFVEVGEYGKIVVYDSFDVTPSKFVNYEYFDTDNESGIEIYAHVYTDKVVGVRFEPIKN
jgi:hypothetical protein